MSNEMIIGSLIFLAVAFIVIAMCLVAGLVNYIFHSVGLYTIAKRMGARYPWLAFVPYGRNYLQGKLAGEITFKKRSIKNPEIWNLVLPIVLDSIVGAFTIGITFIVAITEAVGGGTRQAEGMSWVLAFILYMFFVLFLLLAGGVTTIFQVLITKQILERFTTDNMALVHSLASSFIPFYGAFCLFVMRNKDFREDKIPVQAAPGGYGKTE